MNKIVRKSLHEIELSEAGDLPSENTSPNVALVSERFETNATTNATLTQEDFWLDSAGLAKLAEVPLRTAQNSLKTCRMRGVDLAVRKIRSNKGRGGIVLQVHVKTLPADLRERWYAQHGILLHEKTDPETGKTVLEPEQGDLEDADFSKRLNEALWRKDVIMPIVAHGRYTNERASNLDRVVSTPLRLPNGKVKKLTPQTIYNWVRGYENDGLYGLMRKPREDKGKKSFKISRAWDGLFEPHLSPQVLHNAGDDLANHIRSLWANGARGWCHTAEFATTWLIDYSRSLGVASFDALPVGGPTDKATVKSQFGVCRVHRRMVEAYRDFEILAIQTKDNATFQDKLMPTMRRDYSTLLPRQIVVGDVHPVDIMMRRPDGTVVYPKAIAWYDVATNEIHMTFVLLEQGEGVRREHVAQSFEAMVDEWGLPQLLYLDNGSEYSWSIMVDGFTELTKLTNQAFTQEHLEGDDNVNRRVRESREAIVRSQPYNAKGKPGIEGVFGNLEQVFFATVDGWTAGDRMNKKTHAKGKDPIAFPGDASEFLKVMAKALEWYHKRPQHGRLNGQSPNEALRHFVEDGWGKTVLSDPAVLSLAFSETVERVPDRGSITYTPKRGETMHFYDDALLGYRGKIKVRVPAFNPEFVFCFDGDDLICKAYPEQKFGVLDPRGAEESNRRKKAFRRSISEKRKHTSLLSLTDEMARHVKHLPEAPEVPVAATIDAGILDRLAQLSHQEREEHEAENQRKRNIPQQWKTGPDEALQKLKYVEDDDE